MAGKIEFPGWVFEPDLHEALHRETGEAVKFTRAERALLTAFIESSGRVLQRDVLLDAVAGLDAEVADRSIDFIIHRLRRKLRDEPRAPRYIATQYGEGYVWVAKPMPAQQPSAGAFIVIGPVRGLDFTTRFKSRGWLFARTLARELDRYTADANRIVLDGNCPPAADFHDRAPQFGVTLDFLETQEGLLDCVLTLRHFQANSILSIDRVTVCAVGSGKDCELTAADHLARRLTDALWHASHTYGDDTIAPETELLAVGLHEASEKLTGAPDTWKDAQQRLRRALSERPNDAQTQLMLAAALHSRYVLTPPTQAIDDVTRHRDEAEIEMLVQTALPHLQNNGIFALTAAKLLYFVNKTHRQLALELAEGAFASTTAFANAFAVVGQLRMWEGDLDAAIRLYDQGEALTRPGSHFHLYFLVLKAQAELARDNRHAQATDTLLIAVPTARAQFGLLCPPTATLDVHADISAFVADLDTEAATAIIRYQHYLVARHFRHQAHRRHIMARPVSLLLERFDAGIIPTDIRPDIPEQLIG